MHRHANAYTRSHLPFPITLYELLDINHSDKSWYGACRHCGVAIRYGDLSRSYILNEKNKNASFQAEVR